MTEYGQDGQPDGPGEGMSPKPGRYHVVVLDVVECEDKFPDKIIITFMVLAGTSADQKYLVVREFFATSKKAIPRLQRLALSVGLIRPNAPKQEVHFKNAVGRDLVIEVETNKWKDKTSGEEKTSMRVAFLGFWSTGNPEVSDVPKGQLLLVARPQPNENGSLITAGKAHCDL